MRRFPPSHVVLVAILSIGMCSVVVAKFSDDPAADRFDSESVRLDIALPALASDASSDESYDGSYDGSMRALLTQPESTPKAAAAPIAAPRVETPKLIERIEKVRPGDNLSLIFKRQSLSAAEVHRVLSSGPLAKKLTRIYPGHRLAFSLDDAGELMKLVYSPGPLEALEFERTGNTYKGREVVHQPDRVPAYKFGTIDHSLFVASQRAGLDDDLTMRLAQIFQWDVDFVLDIRSGDEFHVLFEEHYLNGDFIGNGAILAAEFVNRGDTYRALRYTTADGESDYFAPDGASMRKAFLRAPVEFSRISSSFNLRRVHPLWKRKMPHRGIDYAATSGTPIMAAGNGKVVVASRTKANGNYVVLRHGEQFQTKYLHLSKFARGVRKGAKVTQGQTIGYVGATGWATAPHLHYEFLVNGVHKNPRTVKLPKANPVPSTERARFDEHTQPLVALLDNFKEQQTQLAAAQ